MARAQRTGVVALGVAPRGSSIATEADRRTRDAGTAAAIGSPPAMQVSSTPAGDATAAASDGAMSLEHIGRRAWALIGVAVVSLVVLWTIVRLEFVAIPLVVALLPAAALMPLSDRLRRAGLPPAVAAAGVVLTVVGVLVLTAGLAAPAIAGQLGALGTAVRDAAVRAQAWLASRPFGLVLPDVGTLGARAARLALGGAGVAQRLLGVADVAVRGVTEVLLGLIALFFYLKDGRIMARWLNGLFPARWHTDAARMSTIAWDMLGSYIRGQLVIAFADGVTVALGLTLLRVPLAPVLGLLVAFFALFPVVGAFIGGGLAVLVGFASGGAALAAAVVALLVAVFQLEAHLLSPLVLSRSVRLHPLGVIVALGCGAVLYGAVGALIAVPVTACGTRVASYLRTRAASTRCGDGSSQTGDATAGVQSQPAITASP